MQGKVKILKIAAVLLALGLASIGTAYAGVILVDSGLNGNTQIQAFEPLGQSFTAIDANVTAGLYFECINCDVANDDDIRYDLYAGQGTGGALLASDTFGLADGFVGFHDESNPIPK